jgi:hypothetical protein
VRAELLEEAAAGGKQLVALRVLGTRSTSYGAARRLLHVEMVLAGSGEYAHFRSAAKAKAKINL